VSVEDPASEPESPPVPASPSVRRLARELGVDLRAVAVGDGERISAEDVKGFVRTRGRSVASEAGRASSGPAGGAWELPDLGRWGDVAVEELSTVRRLTAEGTARSWRTVPHVTQFDQADITGLEAFIRDHSDSVRAAGGKLSVTPVLAAVCARALKRFRRFNASIDTVHNRLVYRNYVHIGIAVDTPRGLLVPVVRDADRKTITELAVEIFDLAERARNKKVKPDELEGGTFTISNQGGIGGTGFTPIVLWPQVAILGVSRTQRQPQVVGDRIEARRILPLALSYDHRILDGADAARFLAWVCDSLTEPLTMHLD
jgi:pyruvate dehydrogenase E2 component (dihydrolipoamide acetyltransferase)